ncbi:PREDICTED: homocysteine-responsive endoplasmic reticulum-resident ubiquitin-like domain member 2 protein [Ceratosolen solmsi marchali]|uniref:Homocysteine-responsive endoplasmic reticulum-resident ubiquitin-like domain member 2 protein n=1 Tax=Ceratosolen solmsi marchali TaxID=326594 RepID=A0AAJ7E135_9HYME|nr:PREDICTED: homocysteine-responsive endoplasmic reticulum-resident ubiquitin-like domain member 2 protein [Ceratosolen solmsi marchali]
MKNCIIKLIIKVSNQLIEDQTIICNENWSIAQLKEHLSIVYPNNPKPINQNLFYCGQLLSNSKCLKNIFQDDENNEKIYILYLILNLSLNNLSRNLEIKHIDDNEKSKSMIKLHSCWERIIPTYEFYCHYSYLNENQIVWIKQAYEYYLSYYMQLVTTQGSDFSQLFWNFQKFDITSHNVISNENQRQQMILYQADVDLTNFNNENNNANGRDDIFLGNNRDWLDNFYVLSRIVILFSIVYFYSSPLRFIIVTFSGFLIYLYHQGFFNTRPFVIIDNNNAYVENNNQIEQDENHIPGIRPHQLTNRNEFSIGTYYNENIQRPGVLSFTWIFFSSFFASLVPDHPNIG